MIVFHNFLGLFYLEEFQLFLKYLFLSILNNIQNLKKSSAFFCRDSISYCYFIASISAQAYSSASFLASSSYFKISSSARFLYNNNYFASSSSYSILLFSSSSFYILNLSTSSSSNFFLLSSSSSNLFYSSSLSFSSSQAFFSAYSFNISSLSSLVITSP